MALRDSLVDNESALEVVDIQVCFRKVCCMFSQSFAFQDANDIQMADSELKDCALHVLVCFL